MEPNGNSNRSEKLEPKNGISVDLTIIKSIFICMEARNFPQLRDSSDRSPIIECNNSTEFNAQGSVPPSPCARITCFGYSNTHA